MSEESFDQLMLAKHPSWYGQYMRRRERDRIKHMKVKALVTVLLEETDSVMPHIASCIRLLLDWTAWQDRHFSGCFREWKEQGFPSGFGGDTQEGCFIPDADAVERLRVNVLATMPIIGELEPGLHSALVVLFNHREMAMQPWFPHRFRGFLVGMYDYDHLFDDDWEEKYAKKVDF